MDANHLFTYQTPSTYQCFFRSSYWQLFETILILLWLSQSVNREYLFFTVSILCFSFNSLWKTLENLGKHSNIKYTSDSSKLVNNPLFRSQRILDEDILEVETAKKKVRWNLPIQVGYFVYQYAKLRMLEFYYDCLLHFFNKEDFELAEMDTDSLYFAISGSSIDNIVKEDKKEEFYSNFHKWFPSPTCDQHREEFINTKCKNEPWLFPLQKCCGERYRDDGRTPGLFKVSILCKMYSLI